MTYSYQIPFVTFIASIFGPIPKNYYNHIILQQIFLKGSAPAIETNVEYTQFLYNQMVGDIGFILPGILDAKLYSDAGVTTYAYYLGICKLLSVTA